MDYNIISKFLENVKKNPGRIALIEYQKKFSKITRMEITYGQFLNDVQNTAIILKDRGLKKGDRIIVFVPMSYSLYIAIAAIFFIGAVAVFVDAWSNKTRLARICRTAQPAGFIGIFKSHILRLIPEINSIPVKLFANNIVSKNQPGIDFLPETVTYDSEALITLTTGTTGKPKGAVRTHGFLHEQFKILGDFFNYSDDDVDLTALPVFVLANLGFNITSVLPLFNPARPGNFNPESVVRQIKECDITTSTGSPAFFKNIADYLTEEKKEVEIKRVFTGGAPVFKPLAKKLKEAFSKSDIKIIYGSTEAEPISSTALEKTLTAPDDMGVLVGKRVPGIEIAVIKPVDGPVVLGKNETIKSITCRGQAGEIVLNGPHVLNNYIGDPINMKLNKIETDKRTWHRTGDAGIIDNDGNIFIQGRIKNRFNIKERLYYPVPFEQKLLTLREISFSCVIEHKNTLFAVIEPVKKLKKKQRIEIIREAENILKEIDPVKVIIMNKIPRDQRHNSKVNYEELRKRL